VYHSPLSDLQQPAMHARSNAMPWNHRVSPVNSQQHLHTMVGRQYMMTLNTIVTMLSSNATNMTCCSLLKAFNDKLAGDVPGCPVYRSTTAAAAADPGRLPFRKPPHLDLPIAVSLTGSWLVESPLGGPPFEGVCEKLAAATCAGCPSFVANLCLTGRTC